jgi:hypothetical protein
VRIWLFLVIKRVNIYFIFYIVLFYIKSYIASYIKSYIESYSLYRNLSLK